VSRSALLLVVAAAALWALLGVWSTELLQAGAAPAEIAFWRAAVGGAGFVAHAVVRQRPIDRRDIPLDAGLGVVGVALFYAALPAAIEGAGIGVAWVLLYTAPAFVIAVGWLTGDEPPQLRSVVLVGAALAGVALVAGGTDSDVSVAGVLWGLVAAATYSLHYLVVRWAHSPDDAVGRYAVALPVAALLLLPFVDFTTTSLREWLLVVALGVLSTYLPFLAIGTAVRRADPRRVAVVAAVEPVLAVLLAAAVYGDRLSPVQAVGGAIVLAVAVLTAGGPRMPAVGRGG